MLGREERKFQPAKNEILGHVVTLWPIGVQEKTDDQAIRAI